jgi:ribonuclease P protein component
VTHWLAVSYKKNTQEGLRWGWTLSRKIGNAVTRNRLKRWGRESLRGYKNNELDINFIFKIKKHGFYQSLSHDEFRGAIEKTFSKIS